MLDPISAVTYTIYLPALFAFTTVLAHNNTAFKVVETVSVGTCHTIAPIANKMITAAFSTIIARMAPILGYALNVVLCSLILMMLYWLPCAWPKLKELWISANVVTWERIIGLYTLWRDFVCVCMIYLYSAYINIPQTTALNPGQMKTKLMEMSLSSAATITDTCRGITGMLPWSGKAPQLRRRSKNYSGAWLDGVVHAVANLIRSDM